MELKQDEQITEEQSVQTEVFTPQGGAYGEWDNPAGNPYVTPRAQLTQKEFYRHGAMSKIRGNIIVCAVIAYISAATTFLVNVLFVQYFFGIVDVLLLLGLGLGIQLGKSRACAIVLLVYSVINMLFSLVTTGRLGGYLVVICGVYAVISTFQFQKAWKEYETTGSYPGV